MSIHNLEKIFKPDSVAVVGASERVGSVGSSIMRNLVEGKFPGEIYPINPKHHNLWGLPSYASVSMPHSPPDLAVIAVPIGDVSNVIRQCVDAGIKGAVVISAGGKEIGETGRRIEEAIQEQVGDSGFRIVGPNCLGVMNTRVSLNASFAAQMPSTGKIAFVSQSGAICAVILDLSFKERIGFSYFISLGSMMDVDFGDVMDYLGGDPNVSSIVMYIESLTRIRNFMSAARAVSRIKPIVVLKAGRTRAGALAAASHTGALAGEDAVYDAAFKRAGIVRVRTFEELFDCAEILAKQPRLMGPRMAIITNAGGPGVMAADALSEYGLRPAQLKGSTIHELSTVLSENWSHANPIDMIGDAPPAAFIHAVKTCIHASEIDCLLVMMAPTALIDPAEVGRSLVECLKEHPFPVITSWMGGERVQKGRQILNEAGIPTFDTAERAVRAFNNMVHHSKNIEMLYEIPRRLTKTLSFDHGTAQGVVRDHLRSDRTILTEIESKKLLKAYGIPVNPTHVAATRDQAVSVANDLGYPVALKIYSKDITHKTDSGGVELNLMDKDSVVRAFETITSSARTHDPDAIIDGVTVQPMIGDAHHEVIIGAKKDADFGPVLIFGTGGTMTEILKDRGIAVPPLNRLLARRLMEQTRIYRLLQGYRNYPPVNIGLMEEILIRLSQLVTDFPEIMELDINPLLVKRDMACAVDARVCVAKSDVPSPLHLVISPYPAHYEAHVTTRGLVNIFVRPIKPEDADLLEDLFKTLSTRSVYYRFFTPMRELPRHMLARFTQIDYDRQIALVAVSETNEGKRMLGVARVIQQWDQKTCEFSVLVGDPWQRKGIGAELLKRCLAIAKQRGVEHVTGIVLAENSHMLRLCRNLGFKMKRAPDAHEFELSIKLQDVNFGYGILFPKN